jgi:hypothetical protein
LAIAEWSFADSPAQLVDRLEHDHGAGLAQLGL